MQGGTRRDSEELGGGGEGWEAETQAHYLLVLGITTQLQWIPILTS